MTLLQIDPTEIIKNASSVRPDDGSAYGWLISVLLIIVVAEGVTIYFLVKRLFSQEDKKGEFIEKSFQITSTQNTLFDQVDDRLASVEGKQDTTILLLTQKNIQS